MAENGENGVIIVRFNYNKLYIFHYKRLYRYKKLFSPPLIDI